MPEPELSLLFVRPLNELGLRYIVSGSVAAILYGEPRLTHDVDFVIFLRLEDVRRLRQMFPSPEFFREGGSEKHLRDIRAMLAVSGVEVNHSDLEEWVDRCGVEAD